jgi:hypothetical protein
MTSVSGGSQPRDRPDERRRRATEAALLAFRPVMRQEPRRPIGLGTPGRVRALEDLAGTNLHRVLKHRLLIHAIRRSRQDDQEALDQPVRRVLDSTLGGDLGQGQRRSHVDEAKRHLDAVVGTSGGRRPHGTHWEQWVARTDHIFRFSTPEATFRACDDSVVTLKANPHGQLVPSRLIAAEFWSDQPPTAFTTYVDPSNWPRCSPFWKAMRELGPRTAAATGYDCEVEETVHILGETLVVPLQVAHRVRLDRSRVWTRFNIARNHYTPSTPVDVDTGTVSAESITGGPARTLVRATKYLHWSDPAQLDLTMIACASGWSQLMVEMAEACRVPGPSGQECR